MSKHPAPPKKAPKPGAVKAYVAMFPYTAQHEDELTFDEGERLYVSDQPDCDWWKATVRGKSGLVPSNYVTEDNSNSIDFPLHEAAKRGNLEYLHECLTNKVAINGRDKSGSTALYWAAHGGHLPCAQALLGNRYCDVNVQNKLGDSALHAAAWKAHPLVLQLLLSHGAVPSLRNIEDKLPAQLASDPDCAAMLAPGNHGSNEDYLDDSD